MHVWFILNIHLLFMFWFSFFSLRLRLRLRLLSLYVKGKKLWRQKLASYSAAAQRDFPSAMDDSDRDAEKNYTAPSWCTVLSPSTRLPIFFFCLSFHSFFYTSNQNIYLLIYFVPLFLLSLSSLQDIRASSSFRRFLPFLYFE